MPANLIKSLAATSGNSITDVEHKWHSAQNIVQKEYKIDKNNPSFWALVTSITKKMLGMKESITFKEYISRPVSDPDEDKFPHSFTDEAGTEWFKTNKYGTRFGTHAKVAEYQSYDEHGKKTGERCWRDLAGKVYPD
jgi:hypothetical protein